MRGRELDRAREVVDLARSTEPLNLDVEAPRQERAANSRARRARVARAPAPTRWPSSPVLRAGQRDQPVERANVEPVLEHHAAAGDRRVHGAACEQRAEPLEAHAVLAEQREAARLAILGGLGDPNVGADDRLHAVIERGAIELHERGDVALIGDRARGHR